MTTWKNLPVQLRNEVLARTSRDAAARVQVFDRDLTAQRRSASTEAMLDRLEYLLDYLSDSIDDGHQEEGGVTPEIQITAPDADFWLRIQPAGYPGQPWRLLMNNEPAIPMESVGVVNYVSALQRRHRTFRLYLQARIHFEGPSYRSPLA